MAGVGRLGRVVDEQGHPHVRVLLEGGRQQGGADHPDVLPVGGHEDGQRGHRPVEQAVEEGAGNTAVGPGAVEEALPGDQVGQGRPGEGGHDHQVGDGLEREPQAAGLSGQEVAEGHREEVAHPGQDGDHDGHPAHGQGVVAALRRHRREGRPLVGTPLAPPGLACLACAHGTRLLGRFGSIVHWRRPSRWPPTRRLERRNGSS